jgi:hypothetical protein
VSIDELILSINMALAGCPPRNTMTHGGTPTEPTPPPPATSPPTHTMTPIPTPSPEVRCPITVAPSFVSLSGCIANPDLRTGILQLSVPAANCCWRSSLNSSFLAFEPAVGCGSGSIRYTIENSTSPFRHYYLSVFRQDPEEPDGWARFELEHGRSCTRTPTVGATRRPPTPSR